MQLFEISDLYNNAVHIIFRIILDSTKIRRKYEQFNYMTLLKYIIEREGFNFNKNAEKIIREPIRVFSLQIYRRWCKAGRNYKTFMKTNAIWLKNDFFIPEETLEVTNSNCDEPSTSTSQNIKPFSQLCFRQKKRRTEALRADNSPEKLAFATKLNMLAAGNKDMAAVLSYLIDNPEDASRVSAFCKNKTNKTHTVSLYTKEKALAIIITLQLSKLKYMKLREMSIEHAANPYPSYYKVRQAKKDCYPPKEAIKITDTYAEINLQAILDLTMHKILKLINIQEYHESDELILISKWGFDGASGQSIYKQRVSEEITSIKKPIDESIFISSFVPLKLMNGTHVLWENSQPSSTKYCRPIKFQFVQESAELIRKEHTRIQNEINNFYSYLYK